MEAYEAWKLNSPEAGTSHLGVNSKGNLVIKANGYVYDVYDLARRHGTPLEILVPEVVTNQAKALKNSFETAIKKIGYSGTYTHCYPLKSNPLPDIVRPAIAGGASIEIGTIGEAHVADNLYRTGELPRDSLVTCNGAKEERYLEKILWLQKDSHNIIPVIEAEQEYFEVKRLAGEIGLEKVAVGLRVRTGVDLGDATHWNSATEQNPFGLKEPDAVKLLEDYLLKDKEVSLQLLHCHAGSQIERLDGIVSAVEAITKTYAKFKKIGAEDLEHLDIGGGLPTTYDKSRTLFSIEDYANAVVKTIKENCDPFGVKTPNIIVEAGRWTSAPSQITVFGTLYTKSVIGDLRFARVDGSPMTDLPDTWGVQQNFWVLPVNGLDKFDDLKPYWLAGMTCDSDDVYPPKDHSGKSFEKLAKVMLPEVNEKCQLPKTGKKLYIAFLDTGAYQDSLSGTKGVKHCLLGDAKKIRINADNTIDVIIDRSSPGELVRKIGWKFNGENSLQKSP